MMYRFLIFSTFCLGIVSINSLNAQNTCKCDYIESGYYQLIAAYDSIKEDQIIDIAHLDAKRMAIGMPTWEMQKKRAELIDKR